MSPTLPKISIITITFNCAELIERTMQNVLAQTYPNLEYIVIDGGSTDGTAETIARYAHRLAYTISEPDRGIYHAMNKGTKAATGEWLLFRNAGDYFINHHVVEDVFAWYKDEGEELITGNTRCFTKDAYHDKIARQATGNAWQDANLSHPSTFIRRTTMLAHPYPEDLRISSDCYFFMKVLRAGARFAVYPGLVSLFECEEGASNSQLLRAWQERVEILHRLGAPDEEVRSARSVVRHLQFVLPIRSFLQHIPPIARQLRQRKLRDWTPQPIAITLQEV